MNYFINKMDNKKHDPYYNPKGGSLLCLTAQAILKTTLSSPIPGYFTSERGSDPGQATCSSEL